MPKPGLGARRGWEVPGASEKGLRSPHKQLRPGPKSPSGSQQAEGRTPPPHRLPVYLRVRV